jgi:integrase
MLDKVSGTSLSTTAVWKIVLHYAHDVGIQHLAPHDLRRTCAKLCRKSGGDLEQIQFLLGHSSIETTEKILGRRARYCERRERSDLCASKEISKQQRLERFFVHLATRDILQCRNESR